ncbi:MAG: pantoate--beta-alanine ligase [Actinobacteria bacterium]|nr:pantoate--beta-alanine ligase [Actinomycetota bacterium]
MKVVRKVNEMSKISSSLITKGFVLGLVPTMGYLHEGHLSLVRLAKSQCQKLIMSIFVNPTQFGPREDFKKYPRDFGGDSSKAIKEGVDYIFLPTDEEMYGTDYRTIVEVSKLSSIMCGRTRPGHFKGVCTVVLKLFNIVKPNRAYFGQKDYQQVVVIKKMAGDLNLPVDIVSCPIVREKDGLALSSRNKYLSTEERKSAAALYRQLNLASEMIDKGERDLGKIEKIITGNLKKVKHIKKVDYFNLRDPVSLKELKHAGSSGQKILAATAVWIGGTRLIDNIIIEIK